MINSIPIARLLLLVQKRLKFYVDSVFLYAILSSIGAIMEFSMDEELLAGLPRYEGGVMSTRLYDAGLGLHSMYNDGLVNAFECPGPEVGKLENMDYFQYFGYQADKTYEAGKPNRITFSNGRSSFIVTQDGKYMSMQQSRCSYEPYDKPSLQRTVTATDGKAFMAYLEGLEALGYKRTWENHLEGNDFYEMEKDTRIIHCAFMGRLGIARFTDVRTGCSIAGFGSEPSEGTLELCQFGLHYGYNRPLQCIDCGMLYILKLPDNSLFIIDGGQLEQATQASMKEAIRVMRRMSRAPEGKRIPIPGWFCTHAHNDHMDMLSRLMMSYHQELDIQRVLFSFPSSKSFKIAFQAYILMERIIQFYPEASYLKVQSGHSFQLASVRFDVLQTHGDSTGEHGDETIGRFNDTSAVLKISYDGASFLVLGDIDNSAQRILLSSYTDKTLHCTVIQAAHHLINKLDQLYAVARPYAALVPQSLHVAIFSNEKFAGLLRSVPLERQYYGSCSTDIFRLAAGRIELLERFPVEGGEFDFSVI